MPNIWHIWHTNHKNHPSSALPNLKKFETRLQYRHQCQTLFGLFNSFFLSPPIRCISRSFCLAFLPRLLTNPISPRRETETAQACHWSLTHFATKRNSSVKDTVAESENFHQQRRRRRFGMWVCLIWWMWVCASGGFSVVHVGLCRWWMWVCADGGFVWFGGCPVLDVGLC